MSSQPSPVSIHVVQPAVPGCIELFVEFSKMSLAGFGGVLPFAYRTLVERRAWLSSDEFAELLGIGQLLPGPAICNLAVLVGNRYAGGSGAFSALGGLIGAPFLIVIGLGVLYQQFGDLSAVRHALTGMTAVAAGFIFATAIKICIGQYKKGGVRRSQLGVQAVLMALAFVGLGVLRWPLLAVFLAVAPLGALHSYLTTEKK